MCPLIENPENGRVMIDGQDIGDTAEFSCDDGFYIDGSVVWVCGGNGEWNESATFCRRMLHFIIAPSSYTGGYVFPISILSASPYTAWWIFHYGQ